MPSPTTPSTSRADRAAQTRRRLLDAAARTFAERGYAAASVATIGEAAGVSRGLVNFHFASKEKLLHAVVADLVAELEADLFAPDEDEVPASPLAALAGLIDAHRRFLTEQPGRARLLFRLQAEELNPALGLHDFADLHDRWLTRTRPWWQAGVRQGEIDPALDHEATATLVIGALRGIALEWLLAGDRVPVRASYDALARLLATGLRPA